MKLADQDIEASVDLITNLLININDIANKS